MSLSAALSVNKETLLHKAGNGTLFNLSWLAIVTSQSLPIAAAVVLIHLCVHQWWLGQGLRELLFIVAVSLLGFTVDQLLFAVGLFTLDGQAALAPLWLSCLWPVMATTFQHAFSGLQRQLLLAAVLGGVGGYTSYYAGTAMSQIDFADPFRGPLFIAAIWVVLFPALAFAARLWFKTEDEHDERDDNQDGKEGHAH